MFRTVIARGFAVMARFTAGGCCERLKYDIITPHKRKRQNSDTEAQRQGTAVVRVDRAAGGARCLRKMKELQAAGEIRRVGADKNGWWDVLKKEGM